MCPRSQRPVILTRRLPDGLPEVSTSASDASTTRHRGIGGDLNLLTGSPSRAQVLLSHFQLAVAEHHLARLLAMEDHCQLLLVRFSLLAYRVVASLHGGSSFQRIWQPDFFRNGLKRRSTFDYCRGTLGFLSPQGKPRKRAYGHPGARFSCFLGRIGWKFLFC